MIDEEKFVNELKDCWTGREYESNTCGIRVVHDSNGFVTYKNWTDSMLVIDTITKIEFEKNLIKAKYLRIK